MAPTYLIVPTHGPWSSFCKSCSGRPQPRAPASAASQEGRVKSWPFAWKNTSWASAWRTSLLGEILRPAALPSQHDIPKAAPSAAPSACRATSVLRGVRRTAPRQDALSQYLRQRWSLVARSARRTHQGREPREQASRSLVSERPSASNIPLPKVARPPQGDLIPRVGRLPTQGKWGEGVKSCPGQSLPPEMTLENSSLCPMPPTCLEPALAQNCPKGPLGQTSPRGARACV